MDELNNYYHNMLLLKFSSCTLFYSLSLPHSLVGGFESVRAVSFSSLGATAVHAECNWGGRR